MKLTNKSDNGETERAGRLLSVLCARIWAAAGGEQVPVQLAAALQMARAGCHILASCLPPSGRGAG